MRSAAVRALFKLVGGKRFQRIAGAFGNGGAIGGQRGKLCRHPSPDRGACPRQASKLIRWMWKRNPAFVLLTQLLDIFKTNKLTITVKKYTISVS